MEPNTVITEEAAANLVGQWVTVLAFGSSRMAQVETAERDVDGTAVSLMLVIGEPEEETIPDPVFSFGIPGGEPEAVTRLAEGRVRIPTHINCQHDPAGINLENAMVCDGD
jgi:hypothetical protein